ncbi:hypothetical protein [Pseudoflavonifractor sp. MSJ-37]|uniref:hypothetical protein n=1 Tax=Pseudoflavonifractor sp. MSJ-37 TaxID=2841531 RepID=UPI001C116F1B|nr:hypothetical protein [Pseudoflavonifractor sp. MSJ-37]MBU5435696.1 hypothetical protein [Pseudoflavonifractor sp. MSJ-37]
METARRGNWPGRVCYALAGGLIGVFLAVRLGAFLYQFRELALPLGGLLLLSPVLALLGAVLAPAVEDWLAERAFGGRRWSWAVCALSVLACLHWRGLTLDSAVAGGGLVLRRGLSLAALLGGGLLLGIFLLHLSFALWECLPGARRWLAGLERRDWLTVLGLWLLVNAAVFAYAKGSATIYSWDAAIYWRRTYALAETFRDEGIGAALRDIWDSIFTTDYNDTIGLLCVPFALLFGPSRLVYLMSVGNFCLFPMLLLMWGYARSLRRPGLWPALAGIGALPSLFYTSVTGYVDIAGAAVGTAALLLHLKEPGRGRFSRYLLIGLLAALAVVLRRWYAFYALALLLTTAVDAAAFRRSLAPVLGYLSGFGFPLLFFLQTFVSRRLLANYAQMYAAYDLGLGVDVRMLFRYYGAVPLILLTALGLWLCRRREDRPAAVSLLLEPVLCFLIFVRVQSHGQQHLLLYAPALACLTILGIHRLAELGRPGRLAAAALVLPTFLSPALPRTQSGIIQDYPLWIPYPNFSYAPPRRADADEMVELIRRLDRFGEEGETVGLLASSFTLNRSALVNAEDSLGLPRTSDADRSAYLIDLPAVDQRDGFSAALYDCDILAAADPIQLHLAREDQQVVWAPAEQLLTGTGIAAAYEELDEPFVLEADGITVRFFRKVRPLSHAEMQSLADQIHMVHPDMAIPTWPS